MSARRTAETHRSGYANPSLKLTDDIKTFNLDKAGVKKVEIVPYVVGKGNPYADEGKEHFERTYFVHRGIGPMSANYTCPRRSTEHLPKPLPCPICEYQQKMRRDPEADEEFIKELEAKERQLFNVVDHDAADDVLLWDISYHLFGKGLYEHVKNSDEEEGYEFFADPDDGFTLKLGVKERSYGGRAFYEVATITFKDRKEELSDAYLDAAICLDELVVFTPYDELKAIFLEGLTGKDDDEEEEEERPSRGRRSRQKDDDEDEAPRSRRSRRAVADDDDEEPPKPRRGRGASKPPEEEEEESAPRGRRSRASKPAEEEEPAPRSRRGRASKPEPEEEEEEPPKPRRGRGASKPEPLEEPPLEDDDIPFDEAPAGKGKPAKDDEPAPRRRGGRSRAAEEDEPAAKPTRGKGKEKAPAAVDEDDEKWEDWDDD